MRFEGLMSELLEDTSPGNAEVASEAAYMEMQVALEGKAGSQMGDAVIPAQPPNFKTASENCVDLLRQSKHLSLMVCLARAASGVHGFQGLADSLTLMHGIASAQWDDIHPLEDKDDPEDPWWERINLLRELTDNPNMADHLHTLEIVNVRHLGAFSKRDMDIANGRREATEAEKERCNPGIIRGAFAESDAQSLTATDVAMTSVIEMCGNLDQLFTDKIGSDAPSFDTLKQKIEECQVTFREYAQDKLAPAAAEPEVVAGEQPGGDQSGVSSSTGETPVAATMHPDPATVSVAFAGREEVAAAFDEIIKFYQKFEPSSPVPILVFRARQMVFKNFFDILRELAPQHKDNLRNIMAALKDDPLTFLLEHSYTSFLNGESYEIDSTPAVSSEAGLPQGAEPHSELQPGASAEEPVNDSAQGITSRTQVVQTLKDIQRFFEVQEPSSPVPLIVQRVITLVPKTFMDLLTEFEFAADAAESKVVADSGASASGQDNTESGSSDGW